MNNVVLIGRLARDPDLRFTQNGTAVCKVTIAVERDFKNKDGEKEVDFIDVITWRKLAENVAKYMTKGRQIAVGGSLQIRSYEDKNGIRRRAAEVVAEHVQFLGSGDRKTNKETQDAVPFGKFGDEVILADGDLPF